MSNLRDAVGLTVRYSKPNSQYETEFEPASATAWGYFNPKGLACYSLGLLKDMRAHDERLAANHGRIVIVAEESAQLGFPEILFNLFPGMGAYSFLSRRIGMRAAEELILSGRILPAAKLREMGVVDVVCKDGEGQTAVREWIAHNSKHR